MGNGTSPDPAALTTTAVDLGPTGPDNDTGSGRLDTLAAYQWLATTPDFSLTATPGTATIAGGGTATFDVTPAGVNGFAGDIAPTETGLPDQAAAAFASATVTGGSGTSRLTVITTAQVVLGDYPVTVTGTSGSLTRTTTLTLVVQGPPDFTIQVSPATQSVGCRPPRPPGRSAIRPRDPDRDRPTRLHGHGGADDPIGRGRFCAGFTVTVTPANGFSAR